MSQINYSVIANKFKNIQENACDIIEAFDGKRKFIKNYWSKNIGAGHTSVLENGQIIEKAAINFSKVKGEYTEKLAKITGKKGKRFWATGVSSIMHPVNPHAPIIHMNIRYFEIDSGESWFGGGIDLTPHYIDLKEASFFHQQLEKICDQYNPNFYKDFKKQADNYFYIEHRKETRGIGGIFFDLLIPRNETEFNNYFDFVCDLGKLYPELYTKLLSEKCHLSYTDREKDWQLIRRSRYVEFNLMYDHGTKFGLESDGNIESILVSMPPEVKWKYNFTPKPQSEEMNTLNMLKKDIDWKNADKKVISEFFYKSV